MEIIKGSDGKQVRIFGNGQSFLAQSFRGCDGKSPRMVSSKSFKSMSWALVWAEEQVAA